MTQELSSLSNLTLTFINLSDDKHGQVAKCIVNYTYDPEGLADQISYVIYIAIEEIKHFFDKSDWDKAVKALNHKSTRILPAIVIQLLPESAVKKTSEFGLKTLIQVNHCKSVYVPQALIYFVEKNCTIDTVVTAIGDFINSL